MRSKRSAVLWTESDRWSTGELPQACTNVGNIEYYALEPENLADQIVYAINEP